MMMDLGFLNADLKQLEIKHYSEQLKDSEK